MNRILTISLSILVSVSAFGGDFTGEPEAVYKTVGDVELGMYVIKPADWQATGKRGAVVFFHGGGWNSGAPKQFAPQANALAELGVVSFGPVYRLKSKDPSITPLDCISDAKAAMRWVRAHAAEYGVDPDRIAAGGGSAGGHLAASVALVPGLDHPDDDMDVSPVPAALALFNPAVDMSATRRGEEVANEGSPHKFVTKGNPPTIIFHGTNDTVVPISTVEAFTESMKENGNVCELVAYEGAKHSFFNPNRFEDAHEDTTRRMIRFFRAHGIVDKE